MIFGALKILENIKTITLPNFWFSSQFLSNFETIGEIWIVSTIFGLIFNLILLRKPSLSKILILSLAPGVILHEVCHVVICLFTGIKIKKIEFFNMDDGSGTVQSDDLMKKSPEIIFFVSFSPIIIGSLIIIYLMNFFKSIELATQFQILLLYFMISIIISAGPSFTDMKLFYSSLKYNFKAGIRDFFLFVSAVVIYACIGKYLYSQIDALLLQNLLFIHLILILLIQLGLFLIYILLKGIVKNIVNDLYSFKRLERNKRFLPPVIKDNIRSAILWGENSNSSINFTNDKSNEDQYEDMYDENL